MVFRSFFIFSDSQLIDGYCIIIHNDFLIQSNIVTDKIFSSYDIFHLMILFRELEDSVSTLTNTSYSPTISKASTTSPIGLRCSTASFRESGFVLYHNMGCCHRMRRSAIKFFVHINTKIFISKNCLVFMCHLSLPRILVHTYKIMETMSDSKSIHMRHTSQCL